MKKALSLALSFLLAFSTLSVMFSASAAGANVQNEIITPTGKDGTWSSLKNSEIEAKGYKNCIGDLKWNYYGSQEGDETLTQLTAQAATMLAGLKAQSADYAGQRHVDVEPDGYATQYFTFTSAASKIAAGFYLGSCYTRNTLRVKSYALYAADAAVTADKLFTADNLITEVDNSAQNFGILTTFDTMKFQVFGVKITDCGDNKDYPRINSMALLSGDNVTVTESGSIPVTEEEFTSNLLYNEPYTIYSTVNQDGASGGNLSGYNRMYTYKNTSTVDVFPANNIDGTGNTYTALICDLGISTDLNKILVGLCSNGNYRSAEYSLYVGMDKDTILNGKPVATFTNTNNAWYQMFTFAEPVTARYFAIKTTKAIPGDGSQSMRLSTLAAFGTRQYVYNTVDFVDGAGRTFYSASTKDTTITQELIDEALQYLPTIFGYKYVGLDREYVGMEITDTVTTVKAVYERDTETTYPVTIDSKVYNYAFDSRIQCVADDERDGNAFKAWKNGTDAVLSTDKTYTFYASGIYTVNPYYGADALTADAVVCHNGLVTTTKDHWYFFATATYNLPEGATVDEYGITFLSNTGYNKLTNAGIVLQNASFSDLTAANITYQKAPLANGNGTSYMIGLKVKNDYATRYGFGYVTYTLDGTQYTVFSRDIVKGERP